MISEHDFWDSCVNSAGVYDERSIPFLSRGITLSEYDMAKGYVSFDLSYQDLQAMALEMGYDLVKREE